MNTRIHIVAWLNINFALLHVVVLPLIALALLGTALFNAELEEIRIPNFEFALDDSRDDGARGVTVRFEFLTGPEVLRSLVLAWIVVVAVGSVQIIGGAALLQGYGWGRKLIIAMSIMSLFNLPLGTIVGAYSLWVLWPQTPGRVAPKNVVVEFESDD